VSEVKSFYPDELVITVEKGVVSINQEQPYAVPLVGLEDRSGEDLDYAVIIDTQYSITLEALQGYKTLVLVGERSVGFRNDNGGLEIYEIPKEMSVVISRSWVEEKVDLLVELFKKYGFVLALILLPIGVFSGLLFGVMVYLLFAAIIVWFVARIKGMPYSYSQSYVASMHLVMLPQALSTLLFWVVSGIPFFRTILLVILAIINLKNPQQQPTLDSQRQGLTNDPQQNTAENAEQKTDTSTDISGYEKRDV
jgi:hypothetical protein